MAEAQTPVVTSGTAMVGPNLLRPDLPYLHLTDGIHGQDFPAPNLIGPLVRLGPPVRLGLTVRGSIQPPPPQQQMQPTNQPGVEGLESLQRENQHLKMRFKCRICKIQDANILCMPCNHHKMCEECAKDTLLCPACGCNIDYIDKLMDEVMGRRKTLNSYQECREDLKDAMMSTPKPVCHKFPAVKKEAVVSAHKSRFAKV